MSDQSILVLSSGLVGAVLASVVTLAGIFLNDRLTFARELIRLRLESLERFRDQFYEDQIIKEVRNKIEKKIPLTEAEIEHYIGLFEEIGLYVRRKYLDEELIDEILGDYILEAYQDKQIMQHIAGLRTETGDKSYFSYFENLAEGFFKKAQKRRYG